MPSPAHILVVDDDPDIQIVCAAILTAAGYRVTTAYNGQAALDTLADTPVDLILMDHRMPGMDGLTAGRILQENPRTRGIPIILFSAVSERQAGLFAGVAVAVITKPFELETLLAAVAAFLPTEEYGSAPQE